MSAFDVSGLNENFGEKMRRNWRASSGATTASLSARSAVAKNFGLSAWNFFNASPRNARLLRF